MLKQLHKEFDKLMVKRIMSWGDRAEQGCIVVNNLLENIKGPLTFNVVLGVLAEAEKSLGISENKEEE